MAAATKKQPAAAQADEILTTVAAAKHIGISPGRLRIWRHEQREGQPEFIKNPSNGHVRYRKSVLDAWLNKNTVSH